MKSRGAALECSGPVTRNLTVEGRPGERDSSGTKGHPEPLRIQRASEDGWCRRWDLNPEPASTASDSIHSSIDNKGVSTSPPVDPEDHADLVQGQLRDSDPEDPEDGAQ
jgi:hypothetical protein